MDRPRVLVTGGCGFLGTSIVSALIDTGKYTITALDINPPSLGSASFTTNASVRYVRCDILDTASLAKVFSEARPTAVIHTAAVFYVGTRRYTMKDKDIVFKVNVEGTRNVLNVSRESGVKAFVYTSSIAVVVDELDQDFRNVNEDWPTGKAHTSYGQSKTLAENLVLASNTPAFSTCSLRPAPIFGPSDTICIPTLHACIPACQTPFILGSGTNLQDFVYVDNVAHAHVLALANLLSPLSAVASAAGHAFFITNDAPVTARALCLFVWKQFGHVPPYSVRLPEALAQCMGYVAECIEWVSGSEAALCSGMVSEGCRDRYVCIDKARRMLGYEVKVGLEEGLRRSCGEYGQRLEGRKRKGEGAGW